jgi:hypothetical protein
MPITYQKIQVVDVTGSSTTTIDFQSIPATFTDLVMKFSMNAGTSTNWVNIGINGGAVTATTLLHLLDTGGSIISQTYGYFRNPGQHNKMYLHSVTAKFI